MGREQGCEACRYWDPLPSDRWGRCRRLAPSKTDEDDIAIWPVTRLDDWCGAWEEWEPEPDQAPAPMPAAAQRTD